MWCLVESILQASQVSLVVGAIKLSFFYVFAIAIVLVASQLVVCQGVYWQEGLDS
jgi:hypothetical protein